MTGEETTAAEAFGALADATRLDILRALDASSERSVSFSTLRAAVGVGDSGQFNYHLSRLRPGFVEKGADGYRLTAAGRRVVRAVAAGRYTADVEFEPFEHDSRCHRCGDRLHVSYRNERLRFRCPDCDRTVLDVGFPASGVRERTPEAAVDAFARFSYHRVSSVRDGVCPDCYGPTEGRVTDEVPSTVDEPAVLVFDCGVCGGFVLASFGGLAVYDPRVRSFHADRGVDLDEGYYWERPQCLSGEYTTVESSDPWRVVVRFPVGDEGCLARFEGSDLVAVDAA
jgi:DNA-binding transcriptional ArsR family regulator